MSTVFRIAVGALAWLASTPSFAELLESECRLAIGALPAVFAQCADLEVPLDSEDPSAGTLTLAVARIPARTATPAPDPLVLVNGGPGGSGIDLYLQARAAFEALRSDRDIILLDQRGTGRSTGALTCTTPEDLALETATPEALAAAVGACLGQIETDPRLFTTSAAVADLERLREALGVDEWNLYGISYGTRVAQHYLRRYSARVRSIVLDGVVPATLALGPDVAPNAQRALEAIFARCAARPACSSRFRSLPSKFAELERRFAAEPAVLPAADPRTGEMREIAVGHAHFQAVVRLMSYSAPTIALLPLVVDEAHAGNLVPLAAHADILVESLDASLSFPMHNAVVCTEDVPSFTSADLRAGTDAYLGNAIVEGLVAVCDAWPRGLRDDDLFAPLRSDRPALLLSGELDPVTPPAYAERAIAEGLANARHLVVPGHGHGVATVGCVPRVMREFLLSPDVAALETDCIDAEVPTPFFVGLAGPAP